MTSARDNADLTRVGRGTLAGDLMRRYRRECNWLQALEGDIDISHLSLLCLGSLEVHEIPADGLHRYNLFDRAPRYHVKDTDRGTMYTAYGPVDDEQVYHRFSHFIFSFVTLPPDVPSPITFGVISGCRWATRTRWLCSSGPSGAPRCVS